MSNQLTYKKLAELSFDDLYVEQRDEVFPEIRNAVGRAYARIHRSSHRMPQSLRVDRQDLASRIDTHTQETYVVPRIRHQSL